MNMQGNRSLSKITGRYLDSIDSTSGKHVNNHHHLLLHCLVAWTQRILEPQVWILASWGSQVSKKNSPKCAGSKAGVIGVVGTYITVTCN